MEIKVKYHDGASELKKIDVGDWIDLSAAEDYVVEAGEYKMLSLGVSMKLPDGYEAIVAPRSSTFKNFGIIMTNSIGVIDNSYSGTNDIWRFPAYCLVSKTSIDGRSVTFIPKGSRICQFRIQKKMPDVDFVKTDKLDETDRGGFGSTGI